MVNSSNHVFAERMTQKIKRAARLTLADWCYVITAFFELLIARIRHGRLAPAAILRELQNQCSTLEHRQTPQQSVLNIKRLSWAITHTARYVPWRSDCLIQTMAAHHWMRRYRLTPDFFLGVAKDEHGVFSAHAWLRHGDLTITGGRSDGFSPLIQPPTK